MTAFYQTLDETKREIRLLRLSNDKLREDPELFDEVPACAIEIVSLNDIKEYVALSYCWGKKPATHEFEINGSTFWVRPNVYKFLKLAREQLTAHRSIFICQDVRLFIDSVCINQDDIGEKASQVKLMSDVYRGAAEVVAWLGDEGDPWKLAGRINYIHKDFAKWQHLLDEVGTACALSAAYRLTMRDFPDPTESMSGLDVFLAQALVIPFVLQPFWRRLWIVQEVMLARTLTIRYKTLKVSWDALYRCLELGWGSEQLLSWHEVRNMDGNTAFVNAGSEEPALHVLSLLRQKVESTLSIPGARMPWSKAVRAFSRQQCSVVQDKVYGLFGMVQSIQPVNYNDHINIRYAFSLLEGLWDINYHDQDGQSGNESSRFIISLATALGLKLHHADDCYEITHACLKLFGLPFNTVLQNWCSFRQISFNAQPKYGQLGRASARVFSRLSRHTAVAKYTWTRMFGENPFTEGLLTLFMVISRQPQFMQRRRRSLNKRLLESINDNVPQIALLTATKADDLICAILAFPEQDWVVDLAQHCISYLRAELQERPLRDNSIEQAQTSRLEKYLEILEQHVTFCTYLLETQKAMRITGPEISPETANDVYSVIQFLRSPDFRQRMDQFYNGSPADERLSAEARLSFIVRAFDKSLNTISLLGHRIIEDDLRILMTRTA